jgi:predicted ABC-type ATPase
MDDAFRLESSENQAIFEREIEPAFLLVTSEVTKPTAVLIAAQTGAGKSGLLKKTQEELQENAIFVNTDELRRHHPRYEESGRLGDLESAARTQHDASAWRDKLLLSSIQNRRNVIMEGVFKDADGLLKAIDHLKEAGYEVVVRFLGVHRRQSILGVHLRYEEQKDKTGHGRFAPVGYHDECYEKLLETASKVEQHSRADIIEVYNRAGELLHKTQPARDSDTTQHAIEKERARSMNKEEQKSYRQGWKRVINFMERREAPGEQIKSVKSLTEELLKDLE